MSNKTCTSCVVCTLLDDNRQLSDMLVSDPEVEHIMGILNCAKERLDLGELMVLYFPISTFL